jgi:hypothetical protein
MDRGNNFRIIHIYILLSALLFLSACAIKTSPDISVISPSNKKITLKAGYYVKEHICKGVAIGLGDAPGIHIGETLCNGVDSLMKAAFVEVVKLPSLDNLESKDIEVIVIPDFINWSDISIYRHPWPPSKCNAVVKLKWSVQDKKNNILFLQTVIGEADGSCAFKLTPIMEKGIQDHFQKVLEALLVQAWDQMLKEQDK